MSSEVKNPFAEEVAPARRLTPETPPSKHRAGRQKKMSKCAKNRRAREVRESIQDYLNKQALERGLEDV